MLVVMRWLLLVAVLGACDDGNDNGPGVTSSIEHVESTLPLGESACFTQVLLDARPDVDGAQYDCSAILDGEVLPRCGDAQPCWEIVAGTSCMHVPSVPGGADGQTFSIDCLVVAD